eukprot:12976750-Alexandrium_andersonii.AAC.1
MKIVEDRPRRQLAQPQPLCPETLQPWQWRSRLREVSVDVFQRVESDFQQAIHECDTTAAWS